MRHIYFILSLIVLSACGETNFSPRASEGAKGGSEESLAKTSKLHEFLRTNAKLECADECAEETVAIYNRIDSEDSEEFSFAVCTGVRIDSKTIMTNMHCVLNESGEIKDTCEDTLYVQNQQNRLFGCLEIITQESDAELFDASKAFSARDMALIKIAHPQDNFTATIDRKGFVEKEQYSIESVYFDTSFIKPAVIRKQTCTYFTENEAVPVSSRNDISFAALSGCRFQEGHSGSGVKDRNGKYVGLLFAKLENEVIHDIWKWDFAQQGLTLAPNSFDDYTAGVALNFSCLSSRLSDLDVAWSRRDECNEQLSQTDMDRLISDSRAKIVGLLQEQLYNSDAYIDLVEFEINTDAGFSALTPRCLRGRDYAQYSQGQQALGVSNLDSFQIAAEIGFDSRQGVFKVEYLDKLRLNQSYHAASAYIQTPKMNEDSIPLLDCP